VTTRPPAVAGLFYPDDPVQLRKEVEEALHGARQRLGEPSRAAAAPKAAIAPHAGYMYSGPVAASAYARIEAGREAIRRVVLAGPAHRFPLRGVATVSVDALATPLGEVEVDGELRAAALEVPPALVSDEAHALEHSLEVHLPFLQLTLGPVPVLPLLVGQVGADAAADVLDAVFGGTETLVVVSTDLSHYHDYATGRALDEATADAIVARRPEGVGVGGACGVFAVRGLLVGARRHDLSVELLDLRSSGDTAGPRNHVVGYGSFVLA
jgi:AmmeMemoRadiSam system protein B